MNPRRCEVRNNHNFVLRKRLGTAFLLLLWTLGATACVSVEDPSPRGGVSLGRRCTEADLSQRLLCADFESFFFDARYVVQQRWVQREFVNLDSLYAEWCSGTQHLPDGSWKLSYYASGLREIFESSSSESNDLVSLKDWQRERPKSSAAWFAEAVYWRASAWRARGGDYADKVTEEGWQLYAERLKKAAEALSVSLSLDATCAAPHPMRLNLMLDSGHVDENALRATYEDAAGKFPNYHPIYHAMARHFEPAWGGSAPAFEAFASSVAKRTARFEGMGMYARLFDPVDFAAGILFSNEPRSAPYWVKLRQGYEDLIHRYPSSLDLLGKYVSVACRSNDSKLYRKLRSRIIGYERRVSMPVPMETCDAKHHWPKGTSD